MTLNHPKDWYERRIALEGDVEVGAGMPPGTRRKVASAAYPEPMDTRIAFGTFVELWRRNRGWDAAKLAEEAGVCTEEILEIEHNPQFELELNVVRRLAQVFGLAAKPLLELAGLLEPQTLSLREAAVRFTVHSESVAALNPDEREAFEAFMSAIKKMTGN